MCFFFETLSLPTPATMYIVQLGEKITSSRGVHVSSKDLSLGILKRSGHARYMWMWRWQCGHAWKMFAAWHSFVSRMYMRHIYRRYTFIRWQTAFTSNTSAWSSHCNFLDCSCVAWLNSLQASMSACKQVSNILFSCRQCIGQHNLSHLRNQRVCFADGYIYLSISRAVSLSIYIYIHIIYF